MRELPRAAAFHGCSERTERGGAISPRRVRGGTEPEYAARSATGQYRTTPLRALWQHAPYFHDGSAADLTAVVDHYDRRFDLNLTAEQKLDLIEYLKSL